MIETFSRHWNARNILFISSRSALCFCCCCCCIIIAGTAKQYASSNLDCTSTDEESSTLHGDAEWAIKWNFRIYSRLDWSAREERAKRTTHLNWHVKYFSSSNEVWTGDNMSSKTEPLFAHIGQRRDERIRKLDSNSKSIFNIKLFCVFDSKTWNRSFKVTRLWRWVELFFFII